MSIEFPNGSKIIMIGLDNEQKLLSLNNISVIWIEEAFEVEREKTEQLNLRMRGQATNQQLILSWNPISKTSWLYQFTVKDPPESSEFIHSTYRDNIFLPAEYVAALEEMKIRNPAKYRIYGDGEWGIPQEGLVIKNWATEVFDPTALAASGLEYRCGMDLGWVDPSAVVQTLYDRNNKTIYIFNEFYRSGCLLEDLAEAIQKMNLGKVKLYVDSSEPRSIQFLRNKGINAVGSSKGKDSVKAGYMFLQDHRIIVHPKCKDVIRELENFSYIKSKQTGEWTEDTTHEFSHSIDAARYAYSDIYTNTKVKSMSKSALGL
jgi:phage terminase large subunit